MMSLTGINVAHHVLPRRNSAALGAVVTERQQCRTRRPSRATAPAGMGQDKGMQPQQFSLYGAADLGARQTAAQRRQQAAARSDDQPADGAGGSVFDVTEETFATDVVERSRSVPVIVDLWAEWC